VVLGGFEKWSGATDGHGLQPHGRATGLERDGAVAHGTLRVHERRDTYFGRGTTDDKGPALTALFGALTALEAGVPSTSASLGVRGGDRLAYFAETLRRLGAEAATDAVVVSDTVWVSRGRPSLSAGLRGLQRITFHLETAETDQHSARPGSRAQPGAELAQLAGEIFDAAPAG